MTEQQFSAVIEVIFVIVVVAIFIYSEIISAKKVDRIKRMITNVLTNSGELSAEFLRDAIRESIPKLKLANFYRACKELENAGSIIRAKHPRPVYQKDTGRRTTQPTNRIW